MRIIVNADDFGISNEVNDATLELMSRGVVTSATIMANGPCFRGAVQGSQRFPDCSFGVHLNLTELRPLGMHRGLKGLVGDTGEFNGLLDREPARVRKTRALLFAVADEWGRQIERIADAGIRISHLDSHQHVHTIPILFPVLKYVQAKYRIRKVRTTRNVYTAGKEPSRRARWAKGLYQFGLRWCYSTRTTDAFMDFQTFYQRAVLGDQRWPTVEVMTHPGSCFALEENQLLASDWRRCVDGPVSLLNFSEL
jgi:predicted glycoside hydrolase/deacetylase ChbG (UPF0249 family)